MPDICKREVQAQRKGLANDLAAINRAADP